MMQGATPKGAAAEPLLDFFCRVRAYTQELCKPLEIEDYIPQPIVDVSPPKWNIAHTTWFFEEMVLKRFAPGYKEFDPAFGYLFNSYYDSIGERTARDRRGELSRPTVARIFEYRKYVDEQMRELISSGPPEEAQKLIVLGLNHEQQHQELFITDLKYTLSQNPLFPVYSKSFHPVEDIGGGTGDFVDIDEGIYEIGASGDSFCFDNELARHKVYLHKFAIRDSLVTNREFLDFIADGAYRRHDLWHAEGWDWVNSKAISAPLYWHYRDNSWFHYTLAGLRPLPLDAPVCHVSFYEAAAFAEWKGSRLPTEFEWEAASGRFDWGQRWEWTTSAYLPYPGFKKPSGAVGEYNGKFMVNQWVLRGASVVTPPGHSRSTYRNFFHPPLRWQFTGIRLAR
jgi:ergothioneine biosynthesis protein EgtB